MRLAPCLAVALAACATQPAETARSTRQPDQPATAAAVTSREDPWARRLLLVVSKGALDAELAMQRRLAEEVPIPVGDAVLREWAFLAAASAAERLVRSQNPGARFDWTPLPRIRMVEVVGLAPLRVVPGGPVEAVVALDDDAPAPVPR